MNKDIRDILAYGWSVLMYPLFVPTYLMLLFCGIFTVKVAPIGIPYCALAVGGTFFFTCLVPLITLLVMIRIGHVKDLDVSDRSERFTPYIYTIASMVFWCIFLHQIQMPLFMRISAIASVIVLVITALVTLWWKISIHSASAGGALAMIIGMLIQYEVEPWWFLIIAILCCWLLMLARIRLQAHTPLQTVCGFLLGLVVVLIPNILLMYA